MLDLTEEGIKKDCPHCDPNSFALKHPLKETSRFWVVCDVHPLTEGHILIIPKKHLSCVGEFDEHSFNEFRRLYSTFCKFIKDEYQAVSSFEHGKVGQTVFHSHVHLLPFKGSPSQIIPEGEQHLCELPDISLLQDKFKHDGKYLFFSINNNLWTVNVKLGQPRFFRDRFAKTLGVPERGNWKEMHTNTKVMDQALKDVKNLKRTWKNYDS